MYKTSREPGDPVGWHCCKVCTCSPLLVPDKGKCLQEQMPPSSALHLSPASIFIDAMQNNTAYSRSFGSQCMTSLRRQICLPPRPRK